jgi:hypothetical protein
MIIDGSDATYSYDSSSEDEPPQINRCATVPGHEESLRLLRVVLDRIRLMMWPNRNAGQLTTWFFAHWPSA